MKIGLITVAVLLILLFSPFGYYKTNFESATIIALPVAELAIEGTIEALDSGKVGPRNEIKDYLTLESLDNIPITIEPAIQHSTDQNAIHLHTTEENQSSKIWVFLYQKSSISDQIKIELPRTEILYQGKLISLQGIGNISINGSFEVIGLCSLKLYKELLKQSIAEKIHISVQQELKNKILSVM